MSFQFYPKTVFSPLNCTVDIILNSFVHFVSWMSAKCNYARARYCLCMVIFIAKKAGSPTSKFIPFANKIAINFVYLEADLP